MASAAALDGDPLADAPGAPEALTKDGGVTKQIIKKAPDDAEGVSALKPVACMWYEGKLEDGYVFDTCRIANDTFEFEPGKGQVIPGWEIAIPTMKVGERAVFTIKGDYGYKEGSGDDIPPMATLIFEVELLSVKAPKGQAGDGKGVSIEADMHFENVAAGLRRKVQGQQQEVYALNTYSVENVPSVVAVSLKRFDEQLEKIESQVDFPSQLHLHKYSSRQEWRSSPIMQSVPWTLKSVVCHRGRSTQAGHYYSYTRYSKHDTPSAVWLRLDDDSTPCITQTNIWQDPYVKSEAVLFLYELDTDAHTAAMMMLQEEEEQGMFGDAYGGDHEYGAFGYDGFGQGGFGTSVLRDSGAAEARAVLLG